MLEKPHLDDAKIIACLETTFGLTATRLEFLPLGYDANAGVYRVDAREGGFFLKVKADAVDELSVRLPHFLQAQGFAQIIAPLPTTTGDLWGMVDHFTLILYPFIEGQSGWKIGLTGSQWREFGAVLKKLHTTQLPPDLLDRLPRESFVPLPRWRATIQRLETAVRSEVYDDSFQAQLAGFWKAQQHEITTIVSRAHQLGRMLQHRPAELVLCHADIHTANLLLDSQGRLFVIDWDQPVMAPRERDLIFVTVGDYVREERLEALFFEGYGNTRIDPLIMAYYRYERLMEDLAEFARMVFLVDSSDETKQDSMQWFVRQFEPGGAVEVAHRLDHVFDAHA